MNLFDETHRRDNDTGLLLGCVEANGAQTMETLCRLLRSGTRYVQSLIEGCDKLVVVSRPVVMLDWLIDIKRNRPATVSITRKPGVPSRQQMYEILKARSHQIKSEEDR